MGWTDKTKRVAWATLALLCLAAQGGPATADDEATSEPGCFPPCRAGYLCYQGKCIEACNPPCPQGERCTAEGECVPRQAAVTEIAPAIETIPTLEPEPEPEPETIPVPVKPAEAEEDGKGVDRDPPPPLRGGVLGLGAIESICVSSHGCTIGDGEWGSGGTVTGGYMVLPWMSIDLHLNLTNLFLEKKFDGQKSKPKGVLFSMVAGATFLPLKRSHPVEPVFGVHLGYGLQHSSWDDENGITTNAATHGLALQYTLGVDFNLSRRLTIGLHLVVREPIYIKSCLESSAGDVVDQITGSTGGSSESYCSSFDGKRDQFFFDHVLDLRFYF